MKNLLGGTVNYRMTSKTSSLKALLLRAWRERWSDLQWGIYIKTILPRGVSGDVHNLADCILQQALVGPGPNQLVLSYLKHTLSSQMVSYAAVLQRISKYDHFRKPHCVISLLEFLQTVQAGITCRGKPEESVLPGAVLALVNWLLQCLLHVLANISSSATKSSMLPHSELFDLPIEIILNMINDDFMLAVLHLAKHEDPDLYMEVLKKCQDIEGHLMQNSQFNATPKLTEVLRKLQQMELDPAARCLPNNGLLASNDSADQLTHCLQPLLAIEVMQNPCSDTQAFVNQLRMIQRLKGLSNSRLYCELMRACLITVNNVLETPQGPQWGAFTFIKMPQILLQLHLASKGPLEKGDFSQDVVDAFELLLQFTPLLDIVDAKWPSSCVDSLLTALLKSGLLQDKHAKKYNSMREVATASGPLKMEQSSTSKKPLSDVLLTTESLLARILMTLDADYVEIQEPLLSVLCQVLNGKSFELILAVATVEGKLSTFVSKLIKFNEGSKQTGGVVGKNAQTRAMLFDITFLMLCLIVQMYGADVVLSDQGGNSFWEQWVRDCMVEKGHPKSPEQMLRHYDANRVGELLAQFNKGDCEFSTSQVKWHEMCWSIPVVIKEVLLAWEHEALTPNDVKRILNSMSTRMCCLPVCAAAWLCNYMQILPQEKLLKPMNMVQQFLSNLADNNQQENFGERSELMAGIICKMQQDVPIAQPIAKARGLSRSSIVSSQPISEQLTSLWASLHQCGWVQNEAAHQLESLLNTGGSNWFVTNVVKEVLKYQYTEDLDRAVDLAFAIFHLDLEHCTLTLVLNVLRQYLYNRMLIDHLMEPQATALAKLTAYCIFAAANLESRASSSNSHSRKRSRRDDLEDLDLLMPSSKLLRLSSNSAGVGTAAPSLVFNQSSNGSTSSGATLTEPLASGMRKLFQTLDMLAARDGEVSQQTYFVLRFLQLIVLSGKEHAAIVLHDMPSTLVPSLLRSFPDYFTPDLLLRFYDIKASLGRKAAIRDLCLLRNLTLKSHVIERDSTVGGK